jgi:tetratricopeptide (TPR) repeat protein
MLSGEMRRALHLSLAKCWEQEPAPDPEALALHVREAGESLKAALYARTAALAAAATLAFDRAAGLFASALEMGRWDEEELRGLYEGLATVLAAAGRGKEAAKAYQETAGRSEGEAAWRLQVLAAEQLLSAGYTEEGREVLGRALARFGIRIPRTPAGAIVGLLARTAWTRLRGLGFKPRREEEIPRGVLDRIDVCRAAALTMGLADPVRSSMFQARTLHLALAAGEPSRIARQLAAEGGYAAAFGGSGYARSARLLARSRELAEQTRDPQALATFHTCAAIAMFQQGRWEECGRHAEEAERCCLEGRLHAQWELHTSRLFHVGVVGWLGRFKEYRTRIGEMLAEADRRQDLQTANHIRAGAVLPIPLLWDDPAAALRELETCNRRLPQGELTLMHSYAMWARVCVALYAGDVSGALALARGFNARFRRSMLWKIGLVRIYAAESLGNSLLAAAGHVLPVREAAEGLAACIDRMRRIGLEWTATQAQLFEAGRQRLLEKAEAVQAYGAAAEGFERLSMAHYAAAARFRQGCLSESSAAGQELKQQAREAMSSEGVAAPERLFLALAPLPEAFRKQVG